MMNAKNIASCTEKITLFFNKETCESIFDVPHTHKIFFLKDKHFESIVTQFLRTVIFQPPTIEKTQQYTIYCKYFKLTTKDSKIKLDTEQFNQIKKIYDIEYLNGFEGTDLNNNIYFTLRDIEILVGKDHLQKLIKDKSYPQEGTYYFNNYDTTDTPDTQHTHVMILLFMYLMSHVTRHERTNNIKLYRILIIYVYKYVKFIIDQGSAIVTTLEHLKYFFLSNINKIDDYNIKNVDKSMTLYKDNGKNNILTMERIYTISTKLFIGTDTPIILKERVNCGNMIKYRLLSMLQGLANPDTNLLDYVNEKDRTFNLQQTTASESEKKALFIMLAHIKCYSGNSTNPLNKLDINDPAPTLKDTLQKICTAEYDTLEFAQSISSTSQSSSSFIAKPQDAVASSESSVQGSTTSLKLKSYTQPGQSPPGASRTFRGGSITNSNLQHKTKKNIKKFDFSTLYKTKNDNNNHKSFTIKKKYNNANQSIFKIKSKKQ